MTPPLTGAAREAWQTVLDAIEDAIDTDGLGSYDRGELAAMHARASFLNGHRSTEPPLHVPADWTLPAPAGAGLAAVLAEQAARSGRARAERERRYEQASAAGGVNTLPLHYEVTRALRDAGIVTIDELAAMTDRELLALHDIGPARLRAIRASLASLANQTRQEVS